LPTPLQLFGFRCFLFFKFIKQSKALLKAFYRTNELNENKNQKRNLSLLKSAKCPPPIDLKSQYLQAF
jgi:hypothetical protein